MSEHVSPEYTPFYCEENIYRLLLSPHLRARENYAVFISNPARCCPLWCQRAAPNPNDPVFWDYHVVMASLRPGESCEIWDLDNTKGYPLSVEQWWRHTFPMIDALRPEFLPWFRVIEQDDFLDHFSSDRSHMIDSQGHYIEPPPRWERPGEDASNLQNYIDMTPEVGPGKVLDARAFLLAMR